MTYARAAVLRTKEATDTVWRWRHLVAITFAVLLAGALAFLIYFPRTFEASTNVLVVNGNLRNDPSVTSTDLPSIAASTALLDRVRDELGLRISLKEMKANVHAKAPPFHSNIMRISYADRDPKRAVAIANKIGDDLTSYYREMSTARFDADVTDLDSALNAQKDRLRTIDSRLQVQAAQNGVPANDQASETLATKLDDLITQRELASAALQGDSAQLRAFDQMGPSRERLAAREILANDPYYQQLVLGASKDAAALATTRASFTDRYPALPGLQTKVERENAAVDEASRRALAAQAGASPSEVASAAERGKAAALVEADRAKVAALETLIAQSREKISGLPPVQLLRLERDAAQADFLALSSRRATALANRAEALSLGSVVVVDRAIATEVQVGFGRTRLAVLATAIILGLSLAMAFLAEQLDPRLRSSRQIEELYGSPVIATLGRTR